MELALNENSTFQEPHGGKAYFEGLCGQWSDRPSSHMMSVNRDWDGAQLKATDLYFSWWPEGTPYPLTSACWHAGGSWAFQIISWLLIAMLKVMRKTADSTSASNILTTHSLDLFWRRWRREYLLELCEAHCHHRSSGEPQLSKGDIILLLSK